MPEIEDLQKKKQELTSKVNGLLDAQVALSKDIEKIKPELQSLQDQRGQLKNEIAQLEAHISSREGERNESLNQRDADLAKKEAENSALSNALHKEKDELIDFEKHLNERMDKCLAAEKVNSDKAADLVVLESNLKSRYEDFNQQLSDLKIEQDKNAALEKANADRTILLNNRQDSIDGLAEEYDKIKQDLDMRGDAIQVEENSQIRQREFLRIFEGELNQRKAQLETKAVEQAAKDKEFVSQMEMLDQRNKQLELFQLRLQQKIKEKQIDIDIAELQPKAQVQPQ